MNILLVGASGKTGQALLQQLSQTVHSVMGLIRSHEQKELVEKFGAKYLLGDLENISADLIEGIDAVIFVAGSRGKNIQGVDYQGLINMVDAAIQAGVKRFLYLGSINTGKEPSQFVQELKQYYHENDELVPSGLLENTQKSGYYDYVKIKGLAEKYLLNSSLEYTILRAGLLTQELGSGKVNATLGTLNAFGKISRDNVAKCFIRILENKSVYRKVYTILDGEVPIHQAFGSIV